MYTEAQAWNDHCDYELNAPYDYVREANAGMADNLGDGDWDPSVPMLHRPADWEFRICDCAGRPELPF